MPAGKMTEAQLLNAVIELCKRLDLLVYHQRPARTKNGWATAVQGHEGMPDLVIVGHQGRGVLYRELKNDRGKPSVAQKMWLSRLQEAGEDAGLWRPADWHDETIHRELNQLVPPGRARAHVAA